MAVDQYTLIRKLDIKIYSFRFEIDMYISMKPKGTFIRRMCHLT